MENTLRIPLHQKRMGRQACSPTDSLYASIVRQFSGFAGCPLYRTFSIISSYPPGWPLFNGPCKRLDKNAALESTDVPGFARLSARPTP